MTALAIIYVFLSIMCFPKMWGEWYARAHRAYLVERLKGMIKDKTPPK